MHLILKQFVVSIEYSPILSMCLALSMPVGISFPVKMEQKCHKSRKSYWKQTVIDVYLTILQIS